MIPLTGNFSMSDAAREVGASLPLSLTDARVRTLAGKPSGPISMSDLRGKSAGLTATGVNGSSNVSSASGSGTVSCIVSVTNVTGGTAPYTYNWSFVTNPGGFDQSSFSGSSIYVSRPFTINSNGDYTAILQCIVSDSSGKSITVYPITARLRWDGIK